VNLSHLGAPIGPMIRVHGGFGNRMYRLDTDQGSLPVKELNLVDRRWTYRSWSDTMALMLNPRRRRLSADTSTTSRLMDPVQ
jgi:hypothetical protein